MLNDELIWYRKHSKSISATYTLKNFQDYVSAHDNFELFIQKHISDVFTENELKKVRNRWLNLLMYKYARIINMDIPEKEVLLDWFKERIKEQNYNYEVKEYNIETQLIYYLLFYMPKIFSFCAIFYPDIRKFISNHFIKA